MKRWDLVAFFALALVPPAALTVMAGMRATRIPPLVASLPARIEERLGPVARRSHWPGDGVFGARAFDDLQALAVDRASPDATSVLKQALLDGTRPPDEYVALERAHRQRIERILRDSRAPGVDPPVAWRFFGLTNARYHLDGLPFAWLAATRVALAPSAVEAMETCVDAAGVARDLGYRAGLMGMAVRDSILKVLDAPCHRILLAAPPPVRARARAALEAIAAEISPFWQVLDNEALEFELFLAGPALPDRWLARVPREVRAILEENRRAEPVSFWMRVVRVDAWPDLHEVMLGIVSDTRDPAIADRKAAYRRRVGASGHSLNPLALISVPEYGKFSERDLESRTILASLIAAAR